MSTKVLVLGGNGFIGSHLVDALLRGGAQVRILDRSGSLQGEPVRGVDYRYASLSDVPAVTEALADMDVVVHSISTTVPSTANLDPVADIEGNLIGTVRLLQKIREVGIPKLVYISSGGTVYGNSRSVPISEEHARNPMSSYGIVKVAIESYVAMLGAASGFRSLVLRVSNPYGPRQGHLGVQGVIPTFFRQIVAGEVIKIWGDGTTIRDYIYISDLIAFMVEAIRSDLAGVYNVGSGIGASLNEVLALVSRISQESPKVEFLPRRSFDVDSVILDISKARQASDWAPRVHLPDGCEMYWQWLRQRPG